MKNSPPAVAGGLFFCVPGWGVSCPGTSNFLFCKKKATKESRLKLRFKTSLARDEQVLRLRAQASGGHISFCEERNVGKKVA